ncbi:ABC transporter ATP-binding protein [Hoyosella sp. YIM 151337]|uniref:ABC transporter ATP-binding protein n=1 Tax=Hoyosella sp. YIM 151337 TaxID=2992742 RepID=UPI002236ADEF|nr:ABC transporter ATP-binding protein [Hoyosella sp. YIM 151337]MCW4354344.1 ABC transporter ATP-binding protein [Hoyosella sp. YIM 151337]
MATDVVGLTKTFSGHTALNDVSLTVDDGEFLAILGPSGCGKTTLLRLLAGFLAPTAGTIAFDGHTVANERRVLPPERRHLGMVFQSFALWPHLDVAEHVRFPLRHQRGLPESLRARPEARVREVLELTGLQKLASRRPHELSGGQRQRVALARAIAADPRRLLMDEPLSALDAALRDDMRREIQNLHRRTGASIMYVTHDQSEALAMANRVAVMRDGQIEQIGAPADIYRKPASPFVAEFLGNAALIPGDWAGAAFRPAAGRGAVVWDGSDVAIAFRQQGVYPLRPECVSIAPAEIGDALTGIVANALFQGRDVVYVVETAGVQCRAYAPPGLSPGDWVRIEVNTAVLAPSSAIRERHA